MSAPTPNPTEEPAWLHPHVHEPNPAPTVTDPSVTLVRPDGTRATITVDDLAALPQSVVDDCYIVSTGHGTSGPFRFVGVTVGDLFAAYGITAWRFADFVSADDFGTRIAYAEVAPEANAGSAAIPRPMLLALRCNDKPLTREQGLVRLIVPQEHDDALRQVKWLARIEIHNVNA